MSNTKNDNSTVDPTTMATSKAAPPETPLGLQKLEGLDSISIKQKITTFANRYVVTTEDGELLFDAKEDASVLEVMLGGKARGFSIDLVDANQQQVVNFRRPHTVGPSKLQVRICGALTSVVRQEPTFMKPVLSINDALNRSVLRVKGPLAYDCEGPSTTFDLLTLDKQPIGSIRKKWHGLTREVLTDADRFHVRFPLDLDVRYKTAVIGACLLIDFLYYEKK